MVLHKTERLYETDYPLIMGIVNVTPDSFSDGGNFFSTEKAIEHGQKLIKDGADILDIGGESTRPGSSKVSIDEELKRVMPVVESFVDKEILISVDTSKPEIMQCAIDGGADMINDVNALRAPGALELVAANSHVLICLMHMQGNPSNMQLKPHYGNVIQEVFAFLQERVQAAVAVGISKNRLAIDPGFGFGKTLKHNWALLNGLRYFTKLDVPILVGLSRKSMLGAITGNPTDLRVHESVTAALLAVDKGAKIVRVHDVKATKDALAVYWALQGNTVN